MRAPRLRDAIASVYDDLHPASASLSGEAEQAISRRVTRRWATRGLGLAIAGALAFVGANAVVSVTERADDARAAASATASDGPPLRLAQIPLGGGSEFDGLEDYPICGHPAPEPHPEDAGFSLAASIGPTTDPWPNQSVTSIGARLSYKEGDEAPGSRGPLWIVLSRDGKVAGAMPLDDTRLTNPVGPGSEDIGTDYPAYSEAFQCRRLSLRGPREYDLFPVEPGDYEAVAYTRVFATEESVALGQVLPDNYQLAESRRLPGGVYRPGSFDCAYLETFETMVRACLPDVVPGAVVDTGAQTLSLGYDPSGTVDPFEVTLVSDPFDLTLTSWQSDGDDSTVRASRDDLTRFASGAQIVCGATVEDFSGFARMGDARFDAQTGPPEVSLFADLPALGQASTGLVGATVMPWFAPDGSSVRLDAGARLVYFRDAPPDAGWAQYAVAGFATVEMVGVIPHDRYSGPTRVQLRVGEPELCPGVDSTDRDLRGDAAIWGTWTVTPAQGPQFKRELLTPTTGWLPLMTTIIRGD